jgi:hypothetical protein
MEKNKLLSDYMDYWMECDEGFDSNLCSVERVVEDVDIYSDTSPRAIVTFDDNLILLFPELDANFKYEQDNCK